MRRSMLFVSIIVFPLSALLAGCVSQPSPPQYFLLQTSAPAGNHSGGVSVGLHPITVPEYLQRSALLVDSDAAQLRYSFDGRWGEPVADGMHRVSTVELSRLLNTGNLQRWPWSQQQRPEIEVKIAVLAMEVRDSTALLSAEVAVTDNREEAAASHRFVRSWRAPIPAKSDAATAEAYSALVQAMNTDIAAAVTHR